MQAPELKTGRYRHYKNKDYTVLGIAFHSETEEAMAARVRTEIDEVHRSEDVTAKWAELEAKVLTQDLGEEE